MTGKKQLITAFLTIIFVVNSVGIASAHTLYLITESEPEPAFSMEQEVILAYGHPEAPWVNRRSYEIWNATLHSPDGNTMELDLDELDVIVGVAKMAEYWNTTVKLNQKGDYIVTASREPAIYNRSWMGHFEEPPPVRLICEYSKTFVHILEEGNWNRTIGLETELIPLVKPYDLQVGDTFRAQLLHNGMPVKGKYEAAHETECIHYPEEAQHGYTDDNGTFSINLTKPGMYLVAARYIVNESGNWTATHDAEEVWGIEAWLRPFISRFPLLGRLIHFLKKTGIYQPVDYYHEGKEVEYDIVHYKAVITIWVEEESAIVPSHTAKTERMDIGANTRSEMPVFAEKKNKK